MDVRAILLLGVPGAADGSAEGVTGGVPLAALDVLGRSPVQRAAERLVRYGTTAVHMVGDTGPRTITSLCAGLPATVNAVSATGAQIWRACESVFSEAAQSGAELILVQRLGPYLELDYDHLIQFHLDQRNRVTPVCGPDGSALHTFAISASRRNDAAFLFRHQLAQSRTPCSSYVHCGYRNGLANAADLRRLTQDAFRGIAALEPAGEEIRPGVWVGREVRIAHGARILAPAYIGAYGKIRSAAVITRGSALEHHVEVDYGAVVEDCSVLPYTYVGAGLDMTHAVVGNRRVYHLPRKTEVEIADSKLLDAASEHAPLRVLASMASLVTFLPRQMMRGIFPARHREQPASLPAAVNAPSPALKSAAAREAADESAHSEFPNLMVARRYGNE